MKFKNPKKFYILLLIVGTLIIVLSWKIFLNYKTSDRLTNQQVNKQYKTKNEEIININTIRPEIEEYLLSQSDFTWQTKKDSHNFCSFIPLNSVNKIPLYIWVRCSEFKLENNELVEESGISVPVKLIKDEKNNYSHWIPEDGSGYWKSLKKEFSAEALENIEKFKESNVVNLNYELMKKIKDYYQDANLGLPSSLIQNCNQDADCILPFDYAIRSSCPYTTRCIQKKCEVYCPWEEE